MQSQRSRDRSTSSTPASSNASYAHNLENLGPYSTLSCQAQATNVWRKDLKSLFTRASERFPDVSWSTAVQDQDEPESDIEIDQENIVRNRAGAITPASFRSGSVQQDKGEIIWAHKAILYARAPNTFQTRFLNLKTPAANLGNQLANSSAVSLPSIRSSAPSPDFTVSSQNSSASRKSSIRGAAPPSSFRNTPNLSSGFNFGASDSEGEGSTTPSKGIKSTLRRSSSKSSVGSKGSHISRPFLRNGNGTLDASEPSSTSHRPASIISSSSASSTSNVSAMDSDNFSIGGSSILSTASTIKPPLSLNGVNQTFFESTLEYLYTAEESMVETFEFLYDDSFRVGGKDKGGIEERLEKLRQDFTFMWRSKLYSDAKIVLGDAEDGVGANGSVGHVKTIPDSNESIYSLPMDQDSIMEEERSDSEDEPTSFSAHRMILVSRSPYFAAQLLSPYSDSSSRILHLPSPPFTPASLHFTLGFIYTGTLFFSNRTFDLTTAFQIWKAASYLQIDTLQSLISSLISQDFCHAFQCSEEKTPAGGQDKEVLPCKKCVKRIPRVLSFCSSPDVSEPHLLSQSRRTISGPNFGSYWSKEVGNLDYSTRGLLVSEVIKRVDDHPPLSISTLRQLSLISKRIDVERSSKWVEALRWMSESIEAHLREITDKNFETISTSKEFKGLVDGIGFNTDVLEKLLLILIDGLTDRSAPKIYEILVGKVILREDEAEILGDAKSLIEEARLSIVRFLKRKWISVRSLGGFNGLENWCLKELSHELDVTVEDLLLPKDEGKQKVEVFSKTGLKSAVGSSRGGASPVRGSSSVRGRLSSSSRGQNVDGEREAGPIHMRASVLNRNAARHSVANGFSLGSSSNGPTSPSPSSTSNFNSTRRRQLSNSSSREARSPSVRSVSRSNDENASDEESESQGHSASPSPSIMSRRRGSLVTSSSNPASTSASPSFAASRSSQPNRTLSTSSLRSVASSASGASVRRGPVNSTTTTSRTTTKPMNRTVASSSSSVKAASSTRINEGSASASSKTSASRSNTNSNSAKSSSGDRTPTASLLSVRDRVDSNVSIASASSRLNSLSSTSPNPAGSTGPGNKTPTQSLRSTRSATSLKNATPKGPSTGPNNQGTIKATKTFLKATPKPEPTRRSSSSRPTAAEALKLPQPSPTASSSSPSQPRASVLTGHDNKPLSLRKSGSASSLSSNVKSVYAQQTKRHKVPPLPSSPGPKGKDLESENSPVSAPNTPQTPPLPDTEAPRTPKHDAGDMELDPPEQDKETVAAEAVGMDLGLQDQSQQETISTSASDATITSSVQEASSSPAAEQDQVQPPKPEPQQALLRETQSSNLAGVATFTDVPQPRMMSRQWIGGTRLALGIPCIVAPKDSRGKSQRFRAVVKYIGPLSGRAGSWVGVEVPEIFFNSQTSGPASISLNDGSLDGVRYFDLGENYKDKAEDQGVYYDKIKSDDVESFRKPEREARKRRIARMIGNTSTISNHSKDHSSSTISDSPSLVSSSSPSLIRTISSFNSLRSSSNHLSPSNQSQSDWSEDESSLLPSAKKRKDLKGLGLSTLKKSNENAGFDSSVPTKGLFLRPSEILWVVSGNE